MPSTNPVLPSMPEAAVALMYHEVTADRPRTDRGHDAQYSLPLGTFDRQLSLLRDEAGGACCARDWLGGHRNDTVMLTFDDGKASDHELVFPLLVKHGMTADFFVNPATVGHRGFVSWQALAEMAAAGMSIQSHGYEHVYLTRLDPAELRHSLYSSRVEIEDRLGTSVTLLAPPGGRMPPDLAQQANKLGYSHVMCSRPGLVRVSNTSAPLSRLAITSSLGESAFKRWIKHDTRAIATARVRYSLLALAKRAIGDARYERIRISALSSIHD